MAPPRVYTVPLSVHCGETLAVCASYDDGTQLERPAWLRIFRVTNMSDVTLPGGFAMPALSQEVSLRGTGQPTWNREETGYDWPTCLELGVPHDEVAWPLGLYAAQVSDTPAFAEVSTAYFLVSPDQRRETVDVLLCWPWSTTVAYAGADADVPDRSFTSLYDSDKSRRGRQVGLKRPLDWFSEGEKRGYTHQLPFNLLQWMTQEGYLVDSCCSFDIDANPNLLAGYKLLVSVGHDEYWSKRMRDNVESFVASGGNVAFFSANTAWWAVRMEGDGTVMVGHKSAVEDPAASPNPAIATSNWASSPANRPENSLTGVSFRRGSMASSSTPFTIVADPAVEPLVSGLATGSGIPAGGSLFGLETDAADYRIEQGRYVPTGIDGTPLNFRILAIADLSGGRRLGRQGATLGYYTNIGTVFTAGTTDWAARLDDPAVQTVTRNVLRALTAGGPGAAWTLAPRPAPTASWSIARDRVVDAAAIVALFQGDLLVQQQGGPILRGEAEAPASPWTATDLPPLHDATSMGTRLYSPYVYATSRSLGLCYHAVDGPEAAAWTPIAAPQAGTCIAACAAARDPLFAIYEDDGGQTLYVDPLPWARVGPVRPQLTAMAGWNTKLFGIGGNGRLYCREAAPIDLAWLPIGDGPDGRALCLTAHFDRLMAVVERDPNDPGTRTLMWVAATAPAGAIDPWVLFARPIPGPVPSLEYAVGPLPGHGSFQTIASGNAPELAATHIAPVGHSAALLYHADMRSGTVARFGRDGDCRIIHREPAGAFAAWTHVVAIPAVQPGPGYRVLFYDSASGRGAVGAFDAAGVFGEQWSSDAFSSGWTHVVSTWAGEVLFYRRDTGESAWGSLEADGAFDTRAPIQGIIAGWDEIVPTGACGLLFYRSSDGQGAAAELNNGFLTLATQLFKPNWRVVPSASGAVLFYDATTGEAYSGGFRAGTFVTSRHYPSGAFQPGYTLLASLGIIA